MSQDQSSRSVVLDFSSEATPHLPNDLSAVARIDRTLWIACDEGGRLDRLVETAPDRYGQRKQLPIDAILGLVDPADRAAEPDNDNGVELDLEGLAIDGQDGGPWSLWLVGSHSTTRRKPEPDTMSRKEALKRLAKVDRPGHRFLLARVPLAQASDGTFDIPARSDIEDAAGPQLLDFDPDESALVDMLADDPHLGPFMDLPSKENGLDIEGLAVRGERIFLGCRGPVLRGYAVIIELALEDDDGTLKARKLEKKRRYRKYFLPLGGLGTRSLLLDGEDMLILAGPTMAVGMPALVYRWKGATRHHKSAVIDEAELELLGELPANLEDDRPEAIEHWRDPNGGNALLVVHDTPAPGRVDKVRRTIIADVVDLDHQQGSAKMDTRPNGPVAVLQGPGQQQPQGVPGQQAQPGQQGQAIEVAEGIKVQYHPPGTKLPDPQ